MPFIVDIFIPSQQCFIVIGSEVMPVFHHEQILNGAADELDGRNEGIGKNILFKPGINFHSASFKTNGV